MNKFLTINNGGLPLLLNDFTFIDNNIRDTFKALLAPYSTSTTTAIILSGCVGTVSGPNTTYSAGYVAIGGEIFQVDQHVEANNTYKYWSIVNTFDPAGFKLFQDGNSHDTYLIRKAKVVHYSAAPTSQAPYVATNTIHNFIKIGINNTSWVNVLTYVASGVTVPGTYTIDAKKDVSNFVHLRGIKYLEDYMPSSNGQLNLVLFTLPVGYRPAHKITFSIFQNSQSAADLSFAIGEILTNGEVRLRQSSVDYIKLMDFSQVPPFEAV